MDEKTKMRRFIYKMENDHIYGRIARMPKDPESLYIALVCGNKKAARDAQKHINKLYKEGARNVS